MDMKNGQGYGICIVNSYCGGHGFAAAADSEQLHEEYEKEGRVWK
jgi:hypothetical protein